MRRCAGCGTEIKPHCAAGRPRKWCTEECRLRHRSGRTDTPANRMCMDCGQSAGPCPVGKVRCPACRIAYERRRNQSAARRAKVAHRQAMRRAKMSDLSTADVHRMLASTRKCTACRCWMTSKRDQPNSKHLDHIIPIAQGGTHTHGNVRIVCRTCNLKRGANPTDLDGFQPTLWATTPGVSALAR